MRLDFDFHGHGGYAIARKTFGVPLGPNWRFAFRIRGRAPVENLEFKLIDSTGDNVWWHNARDFAFPETWTSVVYKERQIEFAWGPRGGGDLERVATIELVVTAGHGGRGTVWIDDLTFTPLEQVRPYALAPRVSASSAATGQPPANALDGDSSTAWQSAAGARQWLAIDFLQAREYGGLTIRWMPGARATDYDVETSSDGVRWERAFTVRSAPGDATSDDIPLPETESRAVRLVMHRGDRAAYAIREIEVQPGAWAATPNDYLHSVAARAPRGTYPRYLAASAEQLYWTLVGVSGGLHQGLLAEDGMLESDRASFSVEPFLFADGHLVTWADAAPRQSLAHNDLPIPSVDWTAGDLALTITAFADGPPDAATLVARYRVHNTGARRMRATLFLVLRPMQVNPSWQFLNVPGGFAPIHRIAYESGRVRVNDDRVLVPITAPSAFGAGTVETGGVIGDLRTGRVPARAAVRDSAGYAEGVLGYSLDLPPGGVHDIALAIPFPRAAERHATAPPRDSAEVSQRLAAVERGWEAQVGRVSIELPPSARRVTETMRALLAYTLINRNGPRIQPGSRAYARSWIRDGAMISAALLRLRHPEEVRAFAEWYAPFQYPNGKVPCCVDQRGADPVPENDSHGQLIYLIMEDYRYTHDRAFLERMWPRIERAVAYIDSLRASRMTPEYRAPERRVFYGLLPQSISHEGYSAKPMHSYWDDFFALRGLKDAATAAAVLGRSADATRIGAVRDEFAADLIASIRLAMTEHHIDFIPGSAELGDFDATSTTVAVEPAGALSILPDTALRRTFERYWASASRRPDSTTWDAYTPYELRTIGTFVQLGWRDRAHALLSQFLGDERPAAWHEWAEVVWREPRTPKFIGDMPHTWVGSDFMRSAIDLFWYDREADSALVVGAGVPTSWVDEAPGVVARALPTPHRTLDLAMRGDGRTVRVQLSGRLRVPPGGIVLSSPYDRPVRSATRRWGAGGARRAQRDCHPAPAGFGRARLLKSAPLDTGGEPSGAGLGYSGRGDPSRAFRRITYHEAQVGE